MCLDQVFQSCHLAAVRDDDLAGVLDPAAILDIFDHFYIND